MSLRDHPCDAGSSAVPDAPTHSRRRTAIEAALLGAGLLALGGCVAGTEMAVTRYQFDPYEGTAQTYERTVTVDSARGLETRTCRSRSQAVFGPYGPSSEPVARGCEEAAPAPYGGEAIAPDAVPRSVYRSPDRNPLPRAAIPD
ncbi:MAG: hypothetical protein ABWY78_16855 [Microvirga sp.]